MNEQVMLILGSPSDEPKIRILKDRLTEFGIGYDSIFLSAHRNSKELLEYLHGNDAGMYIAVVGRKPDLGAVIAANTEVPVITYALRPDSPGELAFYPSHLLSALDTPPGIAYALLTDLENVATFAATIVGITNPQVKEALRNYKKSRAQKNLDANKGKENG
jgi:phosphoribosylaminoimidazole carboxylase PurE protein